MQVGYVKIGDFWQMTRYNSKMSTVASVVNLLRSQVYHTEGPPLFAAHCRDAERYGRYLTSCFAWQHLANAVK